MPSPDYHEIKFQFRIFERFPQKEYVRAIVLDEEDPPNRAASCTIYRTGR